ncbi:recombination endonuclease subunit [Alishewanella phage vB_AspM_Slicko01]|nr:recombination endonuclease subunit [Alishewanella phage vB_AspM_Slicko01]
MINFKSITFKNFLSFGNKPTTVDLSNKESVLILGDNRDIGSAGISRNGVGKSSLIQAIIYAVYGKGMDKLKSDEFINITNGKDLRVELTVEVDEKTYRIVRTRKPNAVELYYGDKSLTRDSMANTDKAIQELFYDIPYELFMGVFVLTPHRESFMSMSTSEQRNFIESILCLDVLAKRAETLKVIRKEEQIELRIAEEKLSQSVEQKSRIESQIASAITQMNDWEQTRDNQITQLEKEFESIEIFDENDVNAQIDKYHELSNDVITCSDKINEAVANKPSDSDLVLENERMITLLDLIHDREQVAGEYSKRITTSQAALDGMVSKFGEVDDLSATVAAQKATQATIADLTSRRYNETTREVSARNELNKTTKTINKIEKEIEVLESGKCPYCEQTHYDEDKVKSLKLELSELIEQRDNASFVLEECQEVIDVIDVELEKMQNDVDDTDYSTALIKLEYAHRDLTELKIKADNDDLTFSRKIEKIVGEEQVDEYLIKTEQIIDRLTEQLTTFDSVLSTYDTALQRARNELKKHVDSMRFKTIHEYETYNLKIEQKLNKIDELKTQQNPHQGKVDSLSELLPDLKELQSEVDALINTEKHIGYLIKLLTDPKSFVRKNILDQYIPLLNKKIMEHTMELGLGHIVRVKSDLTVDVIYMNKNVSYYNLSQGERLRLNNAVTASFRSLMSLLGKSCNITLVDEMLDNALDPEGMYKTFKFIKKQSDSVWMVSHRDELHGSVDRKVMIIKQNGFSRIE